MLYMLTTSVCMFASVGSIMVHHMYAMLHMLHMLYHGIGMVQYGKNAVDGVM